MQMTYIIILVHLFLNTNYFFFFLIIILEEVIKKTVFNKETSYRHIPCSDKNIMYMFDNDQMDIIASYNVAFYSYNINGFADMDDTLKRRRLTLENTDNIPFKWQKIRMIITAGVS